MKYLLILLLIFSTNVKAKCSEPFNLFQICKTAAQIKGEIELKAYLERCKALKNHNKIKPKSTKLNKR